MQAAPFYADLTNGPDGGVAHWLTTSDGLRIRAAHWDLADAKGTVLIFPGRTEFIEKYGDAAKEFHKRGFASIAIDWRGQGIADRMTPNRAVGHVGEFSDYQNDVTALMAHAAELDLPRPYFLVGHSMGGCIGLRALINGLDVNAAMFSAPMWGMEMSVLARPFAWVLSTLSLALGFDKKMVPGQMEEGYVLREDFAANTLTNDPEVWAMLGRQLKAQPDLGLGGPSLRWLNKSLHETRALSRLPLPATPCLTFLGTDEEIVDPQRIKDRMKAWTNGTLRVLQGGKHEMLMDLPDMRGQVYDETVAFFESHLA